MPDIPTKLAATFTDAVDLGENRGGDSIPSPSTASEQYYPCLYLGDVGKGCKCGAGDEGWALVRYRVKSVTSREDDSDAGEKKNVDLEVREIRFPGDDEGADDEANEADDDYPMDAAKVAKKLKQASGKK